MRRNISWGPSWLLLFVAISIAGCGSDSSSDISNSRPPAATLTISGVVADGLVSGASVAILSLDGKQVGSARADTEGRFTSSVAESELEAGYLIRASGGHVGDSALVGELKAIYGPSERYDTANVTLVTTLVSELAELKDTGTLLNRRTAVVRQLSDIGLFLEDEWNLGEPTNVDMIALLGDALDGGVAPLVNALIADLQDGDLEPGSMAYFPAAHGGILYLFLDTTNNVISGFPGGFVSAPVILQGLEDSLGYKFSVLDGPSGLEIDGQGILSYLIPDYVSDAETIPFVIEATNSVTGKGRTLGGAFFLMRAEAFDLGTVGSEGGTLRERVNGFEIVIPRDSVESDVSFSLLRGRDAEGSLILEVRATGPVDEIEMHLPDPEWLDRTTGRGQETISPMTLEDGSDIPANDQPNATEYPDELWGTEWGWFYNSRRIGQQITLFESMTSPYLMPTISWQAKAQVASTLSCSEPLRSERLSGRIPVLFIHGYTLFSNLGGGEGTWGDFPPRVGEVSNDAGAFLACEFSWITNARFQVVAEDLRKVMELIVQRTGKQAHIVAHSFGGILARTYLQGLAESPVGTYARPVASLTTLGTPHSGIANNSTDMYGVVFPNGQDSSLFNRGRQLSIYQTGAHLSLDDRDKAGFALRDKPGFIAASINSTLADSEVSVNPFPENFPVQVLIGLKVDAHPGEERNRDVQYKVGTGDGLITFEGQRFHPLLVSAANPAALLTPETSDDGDLGTLKARVTERILGANEDLKAHEAVSGAVVSFNPLKGYSHNFVGWGRGRFYEARLECESIGVDETGCDFHNGFERVRLWLASTPSENVSGSYGDPDDTSTTDVRLSVSEIDAGGGSSDIRMFASVVTQNGVPLEQLTAGNFSLKETIDGVTRDVEIKSVSLEASGGSTVAMAIDRSGSMGPVYNNDIVAAKAAAKTFVQNMQRGDQAAIIDFAGDVVVRQGVTRDKALLDRVIDSVEVGVWNGTAAYDAAYQGLELTRGVFGRKAVILMTDGADLSSRRSIDQVTGHATALGVPIYTIGLGVRTGSREEMALIQIANGSNAGADGSGYYAAPAAEELERLYRAISDLLRNAYKISWQSSGRSGDSVSVEISVEYQAAQGSLTDDFTAKYTVP